MDENEVVGQSEQEPDIPEAAESELVTEQSEEVDIEQVEEEFDEVEYEGKKYALPKELKAALLRHTDYTAKTTELAEQRRSIEAQIQQERQAIESQQRNIQAMSQLMNVENTLKQYANVDWQAFSDQDPVAAQKAWFQYQEVQQAKSNLVNQVSQHEQQRQIQEQHYYAKQLEEGQKALEREIKGWSPETAKNLREYGKTLGYKDEELSSVIDARAVKTLHKAYLYDQMMSKATQKPTQDITPKPVTKVGQKAGANKDPEKMNTEEWLKWRESTLRKRA